MRTRRLGLALVMASLLAPALVAAGPGPAGTEVVAHNFHDPGATGLDPCVDGADATGCVYDPGEP